MNINTLTPSARKPLDASHQRGSVLLLLMVCLVLLAMIGATYLQVARVQRAQAGRVVAGDIDAVVDSVISQIATTLGQDVKGAGGYLDAASGDEPYDYPWTNASTGPENTYQVYQLTTGLSASAYGGYLDDKWLASSSPEFTGNTWPNITDLTGVFLTWDAAGTDGQTPTTRPYEWPVNNSSANNANKNSGLGINSTLLVDADGDGIGDSRLAWPPIPVIAGSAYTMAVRIVDLSGRINLQVATSSSDDSDSYNTTDATGGQAPHFESPAELNLGMFSSVFGGNRTELNAFLAPRFTAAGYENSHGSGPNYTTLNDRQQFWSDTASTLDFSTLISDQLDLLVRNGLDDPALYGGTPSWQTSLPTLLRTGGGETAWDAAASPYNTSEQDFFQQNARLHAALISGVSNVAPSAATGASNTKINIAPLFDVTDTDYGTTQSAVATRINTVMTSATIPLGLTSADLAQQLTVNIGDYTDVDNYVTYSGAGYGFEALPMISEVFVQRTYVHDGVSPTEASAPYTTTWDATAVGGTDAAFAVEIGNPFNFPIPLSDVYLTMEGPTSVGTGVQPIFVGTPVPDDLLEVIGTLTMQTFTGATDNAATLVNESTMLYPGKSIIFVFDPSATGLLTTMQASYPVGPTGTDNVLVVDATAAPSGPPAVWPVDTPNTGETVRVGLAASTASDTPVKENYQTFELWTTPDTFVNSDDTGDPGGITNTYYQSKTGCESGVNMIAIADADADFALTTDLLHPSASANTDNNELGLAKTAPAGYTALSDTAAQIVVQNYNDSQMLHIGEIAQISALGYTATETYADRWSTARGATAPDILQIMLDFSATATNTGSADSIALPHAALLLEQFTLFDETFVPGKLNINTASLETIASSLPISDATIASAVASVIINYRDNPTGAQRTAGGLRNTATSNPGVSVLSELMNTDIALSYQTAGGYTGDDAVDTNSVRIDFGYDSYLDGSGVPIDDGVGDDLEEKLLVSRWLSQMTSTRSDCFAAYIWVQEYDASDFSQPVTAERQLIAVFQRDNAGNAQLIGKLQTAP